MKKFRALISLCLVLGMLMTMAVIPAQAAARIAVPGNEVTVNPPGAGNYTIYSSFIIFGAGKTFEYNVNVPSAGTYHISVDAKIVNDAELNIKGPGLLDVTLKDGTSTRKEQYVAKVALQEGNNKLSFTSKNATTWLYFVYAEKAADKAETDFGRKEGAYKNYYLPAIIEAEDYNIGASGSYCKKEPTPSDYRGECNLPITKINGAYTVSFGAEEWAKYEFTCAQDASFDVAVQTDATGKLEFYFDDNEYPILVNTESGKITEIANLYFEAGNHTMKIKCKESAQKIDYISFQSAAVRGADPDTLVTIPPTAEELAAMEGEHRPVWKEIWVDGTAAEGGNGAKTSPYKSIEEAKAAVKAVRNQMKGDIVVKIAPGEYELAEKMIFTPEDGGINGYKVIYQGANALERPIISGGTHVDGWEPHAKGVWKTKVEEADEIRQLYINGFAAQRARTKYIYTFSEKYDDPETPEELDGYGISKLNFPLLTNPEDVEFVYNQLWTQQRVPVKKLIDSGDEWTFVFDQPHFDQMLRNYNKELRPSAGGKSYLENAYEFIDEPGEFYFNRKTKELFYYPFPEENMMTADTVIPRTELMLQLIGDSKANRIQDITFDNIDFRYGAWNDASRTGISFFQADCIIDETQNPDRVQSNGRHVPAAIEVDNARKIIIKNCNFQNIGSSAVSMTDWVDDSEVTGSIFKDLSGTAVAAGSWRYGGYGDGKYTADDMCKNIKITNNVVRRIGLDYAGCAAIAVYYARGAVINNNDIADTPYTGISLGWGWGSQASIVLDCSNHVIKNNRVEDISKTVRDGGHIYMLSQMDNTLVEGNYCITSKDYGGVYFDSGSSMITVTRNVFKDCPYDSIAFGRGEGNIGNKAYNNWSDMPQGHTFKWIGEGSSFEAPMVIDDGNWPQEAIEVMENAGLERGYKRLLKGNEYPAWRTLFLETSPKAFYKSNNIIETSSWDYMEGGEGVAYHESKAGTEPRKYSIGLNLSIGDTNDGEWLCYKVNIPRTADYIFELCYSYLQSSKDENVKSSAGITVYVDGEKVLDRVMLNGTGSWNAYLPEIVGEPVHITEGEHVIKIEFVNAWSFEKFKLFATDFTETEPEFDDSVMLKQEGEQQ